MNFFQGHRIGRYTIGKLFAEGGMGGIYEIEGEPDLLLKIPHNASPETCERAMREIKAFQEVQDAPYGFATLVESGEYKGLPYLVMKRIEGRPLYEILQKEKPLSLERSLVLMWAIANAMAYAHKKTIAHRDLNPKNILIGPNDQPYIIDFGLSKSDEARTLTQQAFGTPLYMSPEQIKGMGDMRSDVYALGVIFYEMLTGHWPMSPTIPNNVNAIFYFLCNESPIPLNVYRPEISEETMRICLKCLSKNPNDRYSTAGELRNDLWPEVAYEKFKKSGLLAGVKIVEKAMEWKGYLRGAKIVKAFFKKVWPCPIDIYPIEETQRECLQEIVKSSKKELPLLPVLYVSSHCNFRTSTQNTSSLCGYVITQRAQMTLADKFKERGFSFGVNELEKLLYALEKAVSYGQPISLQLNDIEWGETIQFSINPQGKLFPTCQDVICFLQEIRRMKRIDIPSTWKALWSELKESSCPLQVLCEKMRNLQNPQTPQLLKVEESKTQHLKLRPQPQTSPGRLGNPSFVYLRTANYTCEGKNNVETVEEYLHKQTGMEFVLVPGGSFMMGSEQYEEERPVHKVWLKPFLMAKYVVTQKVWRNIMKTEPWKGKDYIKEGDDYPASYISWNDCMEFCQKTGLYLPTEAQWEYACRAGTTTQYYWGDTINGDYCWYGGNTWDIGEKYPHEVGKKKPNMFGLYDMLGNMWEWCRDKWHASYDGSPTNESTWAENAGSLYVIRGGSWGLNGGKWLRCANRNKSPSSDATYYLGFRVLGMEI